VGGRKSEVTAGGEVEMEEVEMGEVETGEVETGEVETCKSVKV